MATQGPLSPGTMGDDATVGTEVWVNPDNAKVSDNVYATVQFDPSIPTTTSHYLEATNFGFSIPSGATIDGITVEVEQSKIGVQVNCQDNSVKIVKGGTIGGNEKAIAANWPTIDAYQTYGGAADLWGLTWTDTDINASNFGVVASVKQTSGANPITAQIDHMRITVNYTAATVSVPTTSPLAEILDSD